MDLVVTERQQSHVDLDYKIHKPKQSRKPGRPINSGIKSYDEASTSKKRDLDLNVMN